jgi:preprotein translocase subunit SecD
MITFMPMQTVTFEPLGIVNRNISLRQGLDLSGGSQVLLQATNCTGENLAERMDNARRIIEDRVNGLGVTEPIVQLAGDCRILVELPAVDNPAEAIKLVEQTGRLEFVDSGSDFYNEGAVIRTSGNHSPKVGATGDLTPTVPLSSTAPLSATGALSMGVPSQIPDMIYQAVVTGADLDPASLKVVLGWHRWQ